MSEGAAAIVVADVNPRFPLLPRSSKLAGVGFSDALLARRSDNRGTLV